MTARRVASGVLIVIGVAALIVGLRATQALGISYDAIMDLQGYAANRGMRSGLTLHQAYDQAPVLSEYYGLLPYQLLDLVRHLTGSAYWLPFSDPAILPWLRAESIFPLLGVTSMAVAAVAAATMAVTIGLALRSTLAGAFAWAALMSTPLWLGHAAMNAKDIEVASGMTLLSAGLILMWLPAWQAWVGGILAASAGATLAMGTRTGSVILIAAVIGVTLVVLVVAQIRERQFMRVARVAGASVIAAAVALLVLWLTNPFARIDLPTWLADSIRISRSFTWVGDIRTAGTDVLSTELPWWYVPAWLLANLPLLLTAALAMGLVLAVGTAIRPRFGIDRADLLAVTPLLVQGLVLPVAVVAAGSVLYDGIRHLLFVVPGLVCLAAIGIACLDRGLRDARPVLAAAVPTTVALAITGMSLFACVRWYPYMYAFINPVAGHDHSARDWELDYWGLSAREGIDRLTALGHAPVEVIPTASTGQLFGGYSTDEIAGRAPDRHGVYTFLRWDVNIPPDRCAVDFTIERDGLALGRGGHCPP